ncbi:protein HESO1-like [Arachis stenosperma]|uniref:protein HESO1-like n=1 Tax=Arachis stenosperma TaxID=217475 RepID=UPI0025ABB9B7|nr:protein HESO1-like [Arachis stenosperma]
MESAEQDLLKTAKRLELEKLAAITFSPASLAGLEELLHDTYIKQIPEPIDYHNRVDLVRIFNVMAREIYGKGNSSPVVEEYGSFVMDIFNKKSDLDLSINFNNSTEVGRQRKISTLRKFNKKLCSIQRRGHITSVQLIMTAKVPIIKLTDRGTGIECDLSVENRDGIAKSRIIHSISAIDERFRKLCFLAKSWAQAQNINSSKDRTLNSLSIVSLVAFHLQTCNPPILPPFSALLKEGADPESVTRAVKNYANYGKKNSDSLAKLFITLFVKLASVEQLWQNGLCISLYEGSWILKSWGRKSYSISIEDFTDPSQNFSRAVGPEEVNTIYGCIHRSLNFILRFLDGQMQGKELMPLLFERHTLSTFGVEGIRTMNENENNLPTPEDAFPSKRRRLEGGVVQNQVVTQGSQGTEPGSGGMQPGKTAFDNASASFTHSTGHHCYDRRLVPSLDDYGSVAISHQNTVAPVGNGVIHSPLPSTSHNPPIQPQSVKFLSSSRTSDKNSVAVIEDGINYSPSPSISHDLPIRSGRIPPVNFLASFATSHQNDVASIGNGLIHSQPPPRSRDPPIHSQRIPSENFIASVVRMSHQKVHLPPPSTRHSPYRAEHTLHNHRRI